MVARFADTVNSSARQPSLKLDSVRSRRNDNSGITYGERTADESTQNIDQEG